MFLGIQDPRIPFFCASVVKYKEIILENLNCIYNLNWQLEIYFVCSSHNYCRLDYSHVLGSGVLGRPPQIELVPGNGKLNANCA